MLLLVIAMLGLLPLLAVLQYRWLGKVSEGERERMKENLRTSAARFCEDFDRELTAAFLHFQPAPLPFFPRTPEDDFAERYRRWQSTAAHPQLLRAIYQTRSDGSGNHSLTRFNPAAGQFEPCEWPQELNDLRLTLERMRVRLGAAQMILPGMLEKALRMRGERARGRATDATFIQVSIGPIDDDLPGLIIPVFDLAQRRAEAATPLPMPQSYRVLALDADFITRDLIPELAKRHFNHGGSDEYNLAVTKPGEQQKVIYQSDPNLPAAAFAKGDVTEGLFKIRINEADRILFAHSLGTHDEEVKKGERQRIAVSVVQNDIKFSHGEGAPTAPDEVKLVVNRRSEGRWQLVVKHRAGSLEAAVANARRRNLAISFGILLLLSASVGFIVLSSRRAQKLASQQMEFVAGVSHELRTPLAVICSAAENLADGVIDHDDQIKRYGSLIRDEGRRLTGMVEQVLEFAGAQSGRKTYDLRPTELNRVIEDAVAACHLQLAEGGFEIEKKVAADLPVVKADASALGRAIQNLLGNAVKYSGHSRWIGLRVEAVKTADGEEVQIKISDRGLGIPPPELPHIFEPFYRGQEAAMAQIRGNGLGLSLVKYIVAAHGGRVSVESRAGQGSAFTLHLPAISAEELAAEKSKENYEQAHFAR